MTHSSYSILKTASGSQNSDIIV